MKKRRPTFIFFYLTLFFLLNTFVMAQGQTGTPKQLQNRITLDLKNVPLSDVLNKISKEGKFQLLFSETFIPKDRIVSVKFDNVPAAEALQKVLAQTSTDYKVTGAGQIVLVPSEAKPSPQQTAPKVGIIAGQVTNSDTKEGLAGANVVLEGTSHGASTNEDGMFYIGNLPAGDYSVAVYFVGYAKQTQKVKVNPGEKVILNFTLQPSLMDLDAIVVTGNISAREKRSVANPITTISSKELELMPIDNVDELFEGKVPGGYALEPNFSNRKAQTIALRGSQSFSSYNNQVKMYIDGVEVADYTFSPLNTLDFNDIEKIDILRGPMASTLYGSGASGGVIQIFTKKGSHMGTNINFKSYATATSTPYLDKTPIGQFYSLNLSGGQPGKGYSFGISRSIQDLPYPNNGIKDKDWRLHGGANMLFGPISMDIKASYGSSISGSVNNPYILKLAEERGWTNLPSYYEDIRDNQYSHSDQRASLNLRHVIMNNWYQNLTLGYNKTGYQNVGLAPSYGSYQYLNRYWTKNTINWFTSTKQNLGSDFTIDVTAGVEYTIQKSEYLNSKLDTIPENIKAKSLLSGMINNYGNTNTGYYGEAVLGYQNKLFLTSGVRVEDNSDYGDEYGMDVNPRVGLSYVYENWGITAKPRISWGSSTKAPKEFQKEYQKSFFNTILANPELGPESQSGYEVGADLYYRDWASFEITYYNQLIKNGITAVNVDDPATSEREYQYQNINEFFNKGWELAGKVFMGPFAANFTFTIINSEYGKNPYNTDPDNIDWRYKEGARKLYTPDYTGFLGISYKIPALFSSSKKGGAISMDVNYTGNMLIINDLRRYDGYYNPDIDRISSSDPEYLTEKDGFFKLRVRGNYWFTNFLSVFMDINNLTDYQKGGYTELSPSVGRVSKIGLEIQL